MICRNCGIELNVGAKFCPKCGTPQLNKTGKEEQKKSKAKIIVAIILVIALIAGTVTAILVFGNEKKRFERKLKNLTNKKIVEMFYDDFNNDSTNEMFAIVGKGNRAHFSKAEIWFISDDAGECVKEDIDGHINGILEEEGNKYISVEVENEENSASYIYGVADRDEYGEADISGKYSDVCMKDGKIVTGDNTQVHITLNNNEKSEEKTESTENNKTETTEKTEKTEKTKKTEKSEKTNNSQFLSASESDFNNLTKKYWYWISRFESFDCSKTSAKDAVEKYIMPSIPSFGLFEAYYGRDTYEIIHAYEPLIDKVRPPKDPKNRVADDSEIWAESSGKYWYSYVKVEASKIDWLMKNILNVTPDHNYVSDNSYYYNGYYYCGCGQGGDGGFEPVITSKKQLSDGKYNLTLLYKSPDSSEVFAKTSLTVALKEIDGKKEWSFYVIKNNFNH